MRVDGTRDWTEFGPSTRIFERGNVVSIVVVVAVDKANVCLNLLPNLGFHKKHIYPDS